MFADAGAVTFTYVTVTLAVDGDPERVTPDTSMVRCAAVTETDAPPVPPDALTYPGPAGFVACGGDHVGGTLIVKIPLPVPPVAAL